MQAGIKLCLDTEALAPEERMSSASIKSQSVSSSKVPRLIAFLWRAPLNSEACPVQPSQMPPTYLYLWISIRSDS
jgi:hypothetical protein